MPKQKRQPGIHLLKTIAPNYATGKHEWYWILIAKNGRTIARSSETYMRKRSAIKSIEIVAKHFETNQHYYDHTTGGVGVDLVVYKIN